MSTVNYANKLENFINDNQNIVNRYEEINGVAPLEYCLDEIVMCYNNILKIDNTIDFNTAIYNALQFSLQYKSNIIDGFDAFCSQVITNSQSSNSTQQYFREINDIYCKNHNNYDIEYCEENRDKLIQMNLKTVISIAKKYQGLGLTLNELISAGNLGLVVAWDKFDPERSKLKDDSLAAIESLGNEFTFTELFNSLEDCLKYGDIKKKFMERFTPNKVYTKKDVIKWINSNMYNAKFNSIATMWIRAYILIEIDNNSRIVKKPKAEIYKDREKFGAYKKEITMDIDAPITSDSDTSFGDILYLEDDTSTDLEVSESYDTFKNGLNLLLDGVKARDRSIFLKKFGIGLPRPMLPKEIADQEGLSIARISQIFQTVIEQMQANQVKYDINPDILFNAVKRIQ